MSKVIVEKKNRRGELHCEHGPAIVLDTGHKAYYKYGNLHRLDGPAVITADGEELWFKNGISYEDLNKDFCTELEKLIGEN